MQNQVLHKKILIGALIFISFLFGWAFGHLDFQKNSYGYIPGLPQVVNRPNFDLFWHTWEKATAEYDGEFDYQQLLYGAIGGMVSALDDPYTVFMTEEESADFSTEMEGILTGIGAEIGIKDDRPVIIAPMTDSPAEKAGLRPQDVILKIDDLDTKYIDLNTAVSHIRGDENTQVSLTVFRQGNTLSFTITRQKVIVNSLRSEMIEDHYGYIEIIRFDNKTAGLLTEANRNLKKQGAKAIILDLRNNPGGYLDSAIDVGSEFIKEGPIVIEKRKDGSKRQEYRASGRGLFTEDNVPIVVLINGGSASASEIVAGALQDYNRGYLIGEKSYGKGSVQIIENVGNGNTLHLTVAHWFTPKERSIDKEGLTPDLTVKMEEGDYNENRDPQLEKAVEYLKSKISK